MKVKIDSVFNDGQYPNYETIFGYNPIVPKADLSVVYLTRLSASQVT
jgi:hypothetical protein